ncbi:MFS transporter, partial [Streptomyces sp. SID7982]|nr:MFS transporter [Streptomyces sp. SID7982]
MAPAARPETTAAPRQGRPSANPYLRLLATPGARAFTAGNLIARLPMGMLSVSAVIMIAGSRGSYALAGAV